MVQSLFHRGGTDGYIREDRVGKVDDERNLRLAVCRHLLTGLPGCPCWPEVARRKWKARAKRSPLRAAFGCAFCWSRASRYIKGPTVNRWTKGPAFRPSTASRLYASSRHANISSYIVDKGCRRSSGALQLRDACPHDETRAQQVHPTFLRIRIED